MPTCSPTTADGRPCKDHAVKGSPTRTCLSMFSSNQALNSFDDVGTGIVNPGEYDKNGGPLLPNG